MGTRGAIGILLAGALLWGCGDGPTEQYVGMLDDSDVAVAVVLGGDNAAVYTCGAGDELASQTLWLMGDTTFFDDGSILIDCGTDGVVNLFPRGDQIEGVLLHPDGSALEFTTNLAGEGEGLFDDGTDTCATRAIVVDHADGTVVRGSSCDWYGTLHQVVPMAPVRVIDDTLGVEIDLGDSEMVPQYLRRYAF